MALNEDNSWQRLEMVISWSRMSTYRFAQYIGLPRAETLYQIERGKHGISRKLTEIIVSKFPEINPSWLRSGGGEMLRTMLDDDLKIEFYDVDCQSNIRNISTLEPSSKIILPACVDADFAMIYRGDSMSEVTPPNTVVILKLVDLDEVVYGNEYLVQSSKISLLRFVRRGDDEMTLRLVAASSEEYDDISLNKRDIEAIYKVAAKLIINY